MSSSKTCPFQPKLDAKECHFCLPQLRAVIRLTLSVRIFHERVSTDCIQIKNGTVRKKILEIIFVQNVCVFGTILKQIDCSFCCFLNHIICFCKSRVMLCFVRQGKIPFVPLFIFIEEIVMEVSTTKKLICEDNERNY